MRTFSTAARTALRADIMATQASVTAFWLPFRATSATRGIRAQARRATSSGTWAAYFVASWMAAERAAFSSSVSLGILKQANTRS